MLGQHTGSMDGHRKVNVPICLLNLYVDKGMCSCYLCNECKADSCRYSILPALCSEGIIYADIQPGAYDGAGFVAYMHSLMEHMNPWPNPCSVVVMDNCAIHHVEEVAHICEQRYVYCTMYFDCD